MEHEFIKNTLPSNLFDIQNVKGDNACFYRAVANYIYFAQSENTTEIETLKTFKKWGQCNNSEDIRTEELYQEQLAEYLQKLIHNYIKKNPEKKIPFMGDLSIRDAIPFIHNISYEEYLKYYSISSLGECIYEDDFIIDRWGSSLELFVVSELIGCTIIVFNTQTWSKRYRKIINGKIIKNKPEKNVRLKPSIIVGNKYIGEKLPIYLIWREYLGDGHYMTLYPKNKKKILEYFYHYTDHTIQVEQVI